MAQLTFPLDTRRLFYSKEDGALILVYSFGIAPAMCQPSSETE
jgi:hypothetical protein